MESISVKQLVKEGIVSQLSPLRINTNGYPFVTVLDKKGKALNVYFGKKTSEVVLDTFDVKDNIAKFVVDCNLIKTENADGEVRFKLSSSSSSYEDLASLLDVSVSTDFPIEEFQKTFSVKEEVANPASQG